MKNILVLSPTPSHPQDAGNRKRIFALTKYLQELGATIYFVYCPREWDREIPKAAYDGMRQCWDYFFIAYPVQASVHRTDDEYFELDAWWDVGIEFTINWIKLATEFDLVLCNYIFYSKVLELFDKRVTKVIDTHDIMSNRNYLLDKKLGYRDFFYVSPESEKKALDRAHLVLSIKEDESSWFEYLSSTPVLTIGHLEPPPTVAINREIDHNHIKLGFIGSANPINVKNLESFLDKYLALYGNYSDRLTFVVAGKICQALSSRFDDRVKIIGMVDDVAEFYQQIDLAILPFEFSTGLKIKTVEALSWSKPCMGTINAFEGLGSNSNYHNYKTIEELVLGIQDLIRDSPKVISQLQQDTEFVFTSYTNKVKESIEKLYRGNWKSIKELQSDCRVIPIAEVEPQRKYNFNIVTNVDFWLVNTNEAAWLNLWVENAKNIGNVNIYRTRNFNNISSDKLELYKRGLVDSVHHRELYQIIDLFNVPSDDVTTIDLLDYGSIVIDRHCLQEAKQIELAKNHFLWCFFNRSSIDIELIKQENVGQFLEQQCDRWAGFWDLPDIIGDDIESVNVPLTAHPINFNPTKSYVNNLERVVVGTSCFDEANIAELDKLIRCYRDFLPQHFELIIFSDLDSVKDKHDRVYPLKQVANSIDEIDLFVCIEEPKHISYTLFLCVCNNIPIYCKDIRAIASLGGVNVKQIANFTSIPEAYRSFLEEAVSSRDSYYSMKHRTWELFVEYWMARTQKYFAKTTQTYSTIN